MVGLELGTLWQQDEFVYHKILFYYFAGETTFDEVFYQGTLLSTLDEENFNLSDALSLKESLVSQHFTDVDNSNQSFHGSQKNTWLSFFSCSGKFSKIRRRKHEERWVTRVVRRRVMKWFNDIFQRR